MDVQLITKQLFDDVTARARGSSRRRMNHNFHSGADDNPHRFLNVLLKGTYIRPHRHLSPAKAESFVVLTGEVVFFCFDDRGRVNECYRMGPDADVRGIDVRPGVWHTLTSISETAVCFEVKPGPWNPASDKEFAPWAPGEEDERSAAWLQDLLRDS